MRIHSTVAAGVAALTGAALCAAFVPGPATASSTATTAAPAVVAAADGADGSGTIDSKVRGDFGRNGTVRGTFRPERFFTKQGDVFAEGVLRATLRRNGNLVGTKAKEIIIPVRGGGVSNARGAECDILNLVLGPLDLNLLGLEVHLNRVVLDIVAVPGAGNLLCAIAGLLDPATPLQRLKLANLLNRVLTLL